MNVIALFLLMLHPGHMTRVEISVDKETRRVEVAMKLSSQDLEAALKKKHQRAFDLQTFSDQDAETEISQYLKMTWYRENNPLSADDFHWVGWQRHATHVWVFFELDVMQPNHSECEIEIRSLYEVEPELQHVVELDATAGGKTVILTAIDRAAVTLSAIP